MWNVEFTEEFEAWWNELDADEQGSVEYVVELLIAEGPTLPFPFRSDIKGTKNTIFESYGYNIRVGLTASCMPSIRDDLRF